VSRFDIVERTMLICKDATAHVVPDAGDAFDIDGIFDNAEIDFDHKREGSNGAGGLKFKNRQPVFTTADRRVGEINKNWRLTIRGADYYCPQPYFDGAGWATLWLAPFVEAAPAAPGVPSNGATWR
jgi:hypothetical protein